MAPTKLTPDALRDAITAAYVDKGEDQTSSELALRMGVSAAAITRAIAACRGGLPPGIQCRDGERPKLHHGYTDGHRRVIVYGPTRAHLASLLRPTTPTP